ncbi:MAG: dimethyl sulfoxide reductase anchor subunit [Actinobacteria bacterium]|nr:dimethyl sulfoxide reductase anchor subunit [Actinomycetota bacterium]
MTVDTLDVDLLTPIDRYLAGQADMTVVERFAQRHAATLPDQARYYRDVVPVERPSPGQQYGFEVDLDACTGCKACVTACHNLNGLGSGESWRSVGLMHAGSEAAPRQQSVTTGCHHCVDPACMKGCPVNAYEKDPVTGIVVHLDDQCIGCRYCVLTCPYEVPRYNADLGIVRKCDLCAGRLAAGEAPACVQSCPNAAIRVSLVDVASAVSAAAAGPLVPGAPASTITVPTTLYRSARALPEAAPSASSTRSIAPGQSHPPLAVMLVLTQLAVGVALVGLAGRALAPPVLVDALRPATAAVALAAGIVALAASVCHLGRPLYAFRALLGLRCSWLSREIAAFVAFAVLTAGHGWALLVDAGRPVEPVLATSAVLVGVVGVGCSALVYAVTRRAWWALPRTVTKFALSSLALGSAAMLVATLASAAVIGGADGARTQAVLGRPLALVVAGVITVKLAAEAFFLLRHRRAGAPAELRRSALLLVGPLRAGTRRRFAAGVAAAVLTSALGVAGASGTVALVLAGAGFVALVGGELLERWQFFTAAAPARMPDGR